MGVMVSDRLEYRNMSEIDLSELHSCLSDPKVNKPIYWLNTPFRKEDAKLLLNKAISQQKAKTDFWLTARQQSDGNYVGNINIHKRQNKEAEVGYWVAKKFWKKGYATEMVNYAVSSALRMDDINYLIATTSLDNIGSQAVLSKNGFQFEKTISSTSLKGSKRVSKLYRKSLC